MNVPFCTLIAGCFIRAKKRSLTTQEDRALLFLINKSKEIALQQQNDYCTVIEMSSSRETSGDAFNQIMESEFPLEDYEAFNAGIPEMPDQCLGCGKLGEAICDIIDKRKYLAEEIGDTPVDPILMDRLECMYEARTGKGTKNDADRIQEIEKMIAECPLGIEYKLGEDDRTYEIACGSHMQISD